MSTVMIIVLIAVVVVLAAATGVAVSRGGRTGGGRSLKRRFGPEYDRTLARHDGDTRAAERDLGERVKRHGSLRTLPLDPAARERYAARWAVAQERFVESPSEAVAEADRLVAELAGARGFPDSGHYEDQLDALSVHHAHHVHGYRSVHRAALGTTGAGKNPEENPAGTEELRAAMVEARALFDDLLADKGDRSATRPDSDKHASGKRSTGITRRGVQHG
ncbi:hypothetical protein CP970_30530 [Streptomyces kanamyceticus]|uniref:Secreted protein n=1 Tax=Streptomyces kanamyceticus TaxID=1967 RepID=A0A5J6GJM0_STRKN|nr:hypothetical protein [Streptomyces kanamyceticus]QEU94652.1 hypothetical protein CP970_30530 [Streptomyces kanamyceticus]